MLSVKWLRAVKIYLHAKFWASGSKIEHNSLNFRARSPKFGMQVDLYRPQPKSKKQNGCQKTKWPPKNKMSLKSLNFQAKSPKFCMKVYLDNSQPKSEKQNGCQKTKWPPKNKMVEQIRVISPKLTTK